jgi:TPR repeat protein
MVHPASLLRLVGLPVCLLLFCRCCFSQVRTVTADDPIVAGVFVPDANAAPVLGTSSGNDAWPDRLFNEAIKLFANGHYVEAAASYKKACPLSAQACTNLGFMYSHGKGVELSYRSAADLYRLGCDHGNPLGCTNLGIMYWTDELPKNDKQTTQLFERACREGDGVGCRDLGYLYEHGYGGLEKNGDRAAELYGLAEKLSHIHYIPFHLQDGMVLIDLNINSEIVVLIVDTGSNRTILNPKSLGPSWSAPRTESQTILTPVGERQAYPVTLGWNLDGHKVPVAALACDLNFPDGAMGLFGADLLETFMSVRFDYLNMYIVLEEK